WQAHRRPAGAPATRALLAFGAGVAGGAALAAVLLVPFGELLWLSADLRERADQSVDVHLPIRDALGIFLHDWWGRPTQTPLRPFLLDRALYAGALPLALAAAALVLRPTVTRVAVALFGALWLAVALGVPPFLQVVTRLPVFSSGHNTRLVVLSMLAVALLAGWGLGELGSLRGASPGRARVVVGIAAALLLVPPAVAVAATGLDAGEMGDAFRVAWLFADSPTLVTNPGYEAAIRQSSLILWIGLAGAALALVLLRVSGRLAAGAFVALALALVCVDLFRAGMGYNPAIERRFASVPATAAIRELQRERPARFVSTEEIPQNVIPMRFGPHEARGYDVPIVRRFDGFWRSEVDPRSLGVAAGLLDIPLELRDVTPRALRALRLLGVTHVFQGATGRAATPPYEPTPAPAPLRHEGLREVYSGPDARLYRLDGALPRIWFVPAQRVVEDGDAALDAIGRPGFEPRRTAVTERRVRRVPERAPSGAAGAARLVEYGRERVVIRSRSERAGLVVLADTYYPGWKAEVDGEEVPVERVDYLLRGVPVPGGAHTVVFRYEPLSWTIGWVVSLLALLGLAVALVAGGRRRRATTPPAAD
ncbi:MAG TPA: YfhO family protein, partial [Thermoleophilaceae bacterium]|nr:YfhO family protein [Thermoleophilaceae bacterium]